MLAFAPRLFRKQKSVKNPLCEPLASRPPLVVLANSWERTQGSKQASYQRGGSKKKGVFLAPEPSTRPDRPDCLHNYRYKPEVGNGNP